MLFLVSILIVACGSASATAGLGSPQVTLTINLNQNFASPTPKLPPYSCAAWATQSSPAYYDNAVAMVYAKYVQNVDGNPVGVNGATAQATVIWPSGNPATISEPTTSDGLAVFQVPLQASAVGHETLVEVTFTSTDGHTCSVSGSQDAFFVAVAASPTDTSGNNNGGNGGNSGNVPTDTPSANQTVTDTPTTGTTPGATP